MAFIYLFTLRKQCQKYLALRFYGKPQESNLNFYRVYMQWHIILSILENDSNFACSIGTSRLGWNNLIIIGKGEFICTVACIPDKYTVYNCNQDEKMANQRLDDLATFFTLKCLQIKLFTFLNVSFADANVVIYEWIYSRTINLNKICKAQDVESWCLMMHISDF